MAKSNVSQKDTTRQEAIKTFPAGVVSYSLFDELYSQHKLFIERLDLLFECAYETGKFEGVMDLISQILEREKGKAEPLFNRALSEKGNGAMTIKQEATGGEV